MKEAYYFPHDSNAKDDPKCVLMIEQLGMEGYGIFWMLIETLRDQPGYTYPITNLPALARRYNTSAEKVRTVVFNYGLFVVNEDTIFFSESLQRRMKSLDEKRLKRAEAGRLGMARRWGDNNVITPQLPCDNDDITSIVNNNKGEQNKEQSISTSTGGVTAAERERFFESFYFEKNFINPEKEVDRFIDHYEANGWCRNNSTTPVKNREALARTWKPEQVGLRVPTVFIEWLEKVYYRAKRLEPNCAPIIYKEISDIKFTSDAAGGIEARIFCTQAAYEIIERNMQPRSFSKLNYSIPRNN